ncbi:hypothetical protein DF3PB_4780003 [uncultured Defluviicoccus sp.]|uniref:Uncharacterized protein n=1 Tax=metagenome TaxID=256318 RepID=A0A380TI00_9ZZZZ|nr:hypothetical protein DF3PB_4780003 [uncultured Defluviicoccus sp.]
MALKQAEVVGAAHLQRVMRARGPALPSLVRTSIDTLFFVMHGRRPVHQLSQPSPTVDGRPAPAMTTVRRVPPVAFRSFSSYACLPRVSTARAVPEQEMAGLKPAMTRREGGRRRPALMVPAWRLTLTASAMCEGIEAA